MILLFNYSGRSKSLSVRQALPLNPDYPQGSEHGRGQHQHLAASPTTKLTVPWIPLARPALPHVIIKCSPFPERWTWNCC